MKDDGPATQTLTDRLDPARAAALHSVLGAKGAPPDVGDPIPPFWHTIYFWHAGRPEVLGHDGHLKPGGLIPDLGLPKRMWAGGRLTFHAPLLCGIKAERSSHMRAVTRKTGRTGELGFVTLQHDIRQRGGLAVTEERDLVYRPADAAPAQTPLAPKAAEETETLCFDTVALFRYSALTMNGHRIHYDADYARTVEGYPGPVVHGPLLALHLMRMAEARLGGLSQFAFRATSPLFAGETAQFCRNGNSYWVAGPDGRLCMTGEAS